MDDACHPRVLDCGGRSRRAGGDTAFACHQRTRYHLKRAPTSTNACRHTRMARHNHPPDRNQRHVGDLTHHASKLYVKEQTGPMPLRKERRHPAHGTDRITHLIYIPFRKSQALFSPFLRLANDDARSRLSIFISHPYPLAARRSPPQAGIATASPCSNTICDLFGKGGWKFINVDSSLLRTNRVTVPGSSQNSQYQAPVDPTLPTSFTVCCRPTDPAPVGERRNFDLNKWVVATVGQSQG